jgi:hypothetical protein
MTDNDAFAEVIVNEGEKTCVGFNGQFRRGRVAFTPQPMGGERYVVRWFPTL